VVAELEEAVQISVWNAKDGLHLTSDLGFYAAEVKAHDLHGAVRDLHATQLTANSYENYVDIITDMYHEHRNRLLQYMMPCVTLASGYHQIVRWFASACEVAINIHLDTIEAPNTCFLPRLVPHSLRGMQIERIEQIDRDVLWRILTIDPWLSYAERARAQHSRMVTALSQPGGIEKLPKVIDELAKSIPDVPDRERHQRQRLQEGKRSIRKAYKLQDRLFGSRQLRRLFCTRAERARLGTLTLEGHLFSYALWVDQGELLHRTLSTNTGVPPVHVAIMRKGTRQRLCTFCVYFEDTPLIDYMTAFMLHIKTEETELDLLRVGQVQNLTSEFYTDPILPDLKGIHNPIDAPSALISNIMSHAEQDVQRGPLRFTELDLNALANELLGYSDDLLDVMVDGQKFSEWAMIEGTPDALLILDRAKNLFR